MKTNLNITQGYSQNRLGNPTKKYSNFNQESNQGNPPSFGIKLDITDFAANLRKLWKGSPYLEQKAELIIQLFEVFEKGFKVKWKGNKLYSFPSLESIKNINEKDVSNYTIKLDVKPDPYFFEEKGAKNYINVYREITDANGETILKKEKYMDDNYSRAIYRGPNSPYDGESVEKYVKNHYLEDMGFIARFNEAITYSINALETILKNGTAKVIGNAGQLTTAPIDIPELNPAQDKEVMALIMKHFNVDEAGAKGCIEQILTNAGDLGEKMTLPDWENVLKEMDKMDLVYAPGEFVALSK